MACLLKRNFAGDGLRLAVVELPLWVDVEPAAGVFVQEALDVAGLALPFISGSLTAKG